MRQLPVIYFCGAYPNLSGLTGTQFNKREIRHHIIHYLYPDCLPFLAHLSRRLIGELIVYPCSGVRPSSVVRPSSSTISKIFFSETAGPIVLILHIHHLQVGGKNNCVFCFDRIRTLVAMATYASHRLIMEKSENCPSFCCLVGDI